MSEDIQVRLNGKDRQVEAGPDLLSSPLDRPPVRAVPATHVRHLGGDRLVALEATGRVGQEAGEIVGDRGLETDVEVGAHHQCDGDHHRPHRHLDLPPDRLQAVGEAAPPDHQRV